MINLKDFPTKAGVYFFKVNEEIIYIGSSNNLYQRMGEHRSSIKKGSKNGRQQDLYQFLQNNSFTVEFQLAADNYRQLEQQLIEKYNPKYNCLRAYTGLGAYKGREAEYEKQRNIKFNEERKQYRKQYRSQPCFYNGETLTLCALIGRFRRKGIPSPAAEAKKYLIR